MLKKIQCFIHRKNKNIIKNKKRNYIETQLEKINKDEYFIIDVRTRKEYLEFHLNNSTNIPLANLKEKIEKIQPDKNKKMLLYCQSGGRSIKAAQILEKLGYTKIYNLKGGIENI